MSFPPGFANVVAMSMAHAKGLEVGLTKFIGTGLAWVNLSLVDQQNTYVGVDVGASQAPSKVTLENTFDVLGSTDVARFLRGCMRKLKLCRGAIRDMMETKGAYGHNPCFSLIQVAQHYAELAFDFHSQQMPTFNLSADGEHYTFNTEASFGYFSSDLLFDFIVYNYIEVYGQVGQGGENPAKDAFTRDLFNFLDSCNCEWAFLPTASFKKGINNTRLTFTTIQHQGVVADREDYPLHSGLEANVTAFKAAVGGQDGDIEQGVKALVDLSTLHKMLYPYILCCLGRWPKCPLYHDGYSRFLAPPDSDADADSEDEDESSPSASGEPSQEEGSGSVDDMDID